MKGVLCAIALLALAVFGADADEARSWYVAPLGLDDGPGSLENPFETIARAIQAAADGDTVILYSGVYEGPGNCAVKINKDITVTAMGGGVGHSFINCGGTSPMAGFTTASVKTNVTLVGLTIQGCFGSGVTVASGNASLIDMQLFSNIGQQGGGIFAGGGTEVYIHNCDIENNQALKGAGIYGSTGAFIHINENTRIFNNEASEDGGAIYHQNGDLDMPNGAYLIQGNVAGGNGGGLYLQQVKANIGDGPFHDNSAKKSGGGIYATGVSVLSITDAEFMNCVSEEDGGALYLDAGSHLLCAHTDFHNNKAKNGGGMAINGKSKMIANSNTYHENVAMQLGGGIFMLDGIIMDSSLGSEDFDGNKATSGGGIYAKAGTIMSMQSDFFNNSVATNGGAIYVSAGVSATFQLSQIGQNSAQAGGGIYCEGAMVNFFSSHIGGNKGEPTNLACDQKCVFKSDHSGKCRCGQCDGRLVPLANSELRKADDEPRKLQTWFASPLGDDGNSGLSNEKAFETVSKAVSMAETGDTVILMAGVYDGKGNCGITISKDITVRSVDGETGHVFINCGGRTPLHGLTLKSQLDKITLMGITIQGCLGSAVDVYAGNASLVRMQFIDNIGQNGGGVFVGSGANAVVEESDFQQNQATNGGAAYVGLYATLLVRKNTKFINNDASISGGAIFATNADVVLEDGGYEVSGNAAGENGGAIYSEASTFKMGDGSLHMNRALKSGGTFYLAGTSDVLLSNVEVLKSEATNGDGGALYITGGSRLQIEHCDFNECKAGGHGGALAVLDNSKVAANSNTYHECVAAQNGGALYINSAVVQDSDDGSESFELNEAALGGGMYAESATLMSTKADFSNNTAWEEGGALYLKSSVVSLQLANIGFNKAKKGGGILCDASTLNVFSSHIGGNVGEPDNLQCSSTCTFKAVHSGTCDCASCGKEKVKAKEVKVPKKKLGFKL